MNLAEFPQRANSIAQSRRGVVRRAISSTNRGRVYFQSTTWPAQLANPNIAIKLEPETPVEIVGREGITLLVRPVDQGGETS